MPDSLFLLFTRPLEAAGFRYAVTGSVASTVYGEPRFTNDVDVLLDIDASQVDALSGCFPLTDFYFPPAEVVSVEIARPLRGHFNVIHHDTGFKADMYPKGSDPLRAWALSSPVRVEIDGGSVAFAPAEYVIIRKLEFHREGGSQKHVDDITAMVRELGPALDRALVERHVTRLGLDAAWRRIVSG